MNHAINNNWVFTPSFEKSFLTNKVEGETIHLPHTVKKLPLNYFNKEDFECISTYQKELNYNFSDNELIYIIFEGVMTSCKVYLNGLFIGEHFGGYTKFKYDITNYFIKNKTNLLTVVVNSFEQCNIPPFGGVVDYLTFGGIYREVSIEIVPKINISCLNVEGDMYGQIRIRKDIFNENNEEYQIQHVLKYDNQVIATFDNDFHHIVKPNIWDIDNPNLYYLETTITSKYGQETYINRFGFRSIAFKEDGIYLNENHLKLIGLNRHQSYPYVGYAMPKSMQEDDANILKNKLGVNYVRCSHYPMSKHFLNRCDELGLLLLEEIPGWQFVSKDEEWRKHHLENVKDMIKTDFNHPCIILWGVRINEGPDDHELYVKSNEIAKILDPNRPTGGVRNFKHSELLEDVYTYNDFYHNGKNYGLDKAEKVCKKSPYLVTEFNGHMFPTKSFDHEDRLVEHTLRHARVLDAMYGSKRISGCSGWCMNDYNTHKEFGSGDMICYHGVNDIFRNEKFAASIYASQQDRFPVLKVLSSLCGGEKNEALQGITYVSTNADYIEFYKNGNFINKFYPDKKQFPHLPHSPIIIDDYVGDAIVNENIFQEKDARKVTKVLNHILVNGINSMKLSHIFLLAKILIKYKMSIDTLVRTMTKFATSWGDKSVEYEVKAFKNNECIDTQKFGPSNEFKLSAPSNITLTIGDTYDVKEIIIKAIDQNNQLLRYCFEPLSISIEGDIELISPNLVSLQAGAIGIYIKSLKEGKGTVIVESRFNKLEISVNIVKE